jgi:hypothetical protein
MSTRTSLIIGGRRIRAGEQRDIHLQVSETYTGDPVKIAIRVIRARRPGPRLLITAAVHGDELNGTGIIREMLFGEAPALKRGSLICVPVVNVFGFERNERDMPDRRDLNRSFPGSALGSLASRVAHAFLSQVVSQADLCIDLHSAAATRTNYPNVRGDLSIPEVRALAEALGCELIVNGKGPEGSLRRAACDLGCPTVILEAGEVAKIEPTVLELGLRGINNVLVALDMIDGRRQEPVYQTTVHKTTWVRAELGGLLRFHVAPGALVEGGEPIATNESVFGEAQSVLISPTDGIILGMTTLPAVKPGEPVVHVALPRKKLSSIRRALQNAPQQSLAYRLRHELATNVSVHDSALMPPMRRRRPRR